MGKQAGDQAQAQTQIPSSLPLPRKRSRRSSQAQISPSYQRSKRSRTLDHAPPPGLCSCSSAAQKIPSTRVPKRKSHDVHGPGSTAQIYWRAKRARTAPRRNWRDWANLEDGPAGLIADLVLANDVVDYIRFRAVCPPWRRCCVTPRACGVLDRRFHPGQRWIMLRDKHARIMVGEEAARIMLREKPAEPQTRRRFLNVSTGQCVQVDIPELRDHSLLHSTSEGLLVLLGTTTNALRLLNPLTRQVAEFPQITSLGFDFSGDFLDSAGLADERTLVLYYGAVKTLAFAKPGDEHWVLVKFEKFLQPTLSFAARFYGVTTDAVMVVETREGLPPRLVVAAKLAKPFSRMCDTVHLVDNDGQLMLVHRTIREIRGADGCYKWSYEVYEVDLDARKVAPAHGLNGQAVFICYDCALSVYPQVFLPYITADTIYPGLNMPERVGREQIGGYHVKDGSIEPSNYDMWSGLAHPLSVADLLADYVSG